MAMKSTSEDLKRENEEQRVEIRRLEAERSATLAQHAALKAAIESGKRQRRALMEKQQQLVDVVDEVHKNQTRAAELLEESKGNYDVSSKLVEDRLKDDTEVLEKLKTMTENLTTKAEELDREKSHSRKLSADLGNLHTQFDSAMDELAETKKELKETEKRSTELKLELEKSLDLLNTKGEQMKTLERAQVEVENNMKILHEDNMRVVKNQLKDAQERSAAAQEQIVAWEAKSVELERKLANTKRELGMKSRDHDTLKLTVPTMASEIDSLRAKNRSYELRVGDTNTEMEKLEAEIHAKNAELKSALTEKRGSESELQAMHVKHDALSNQHEALKGTIEKQRNELETLQTKVKTLEVALETADRTQEAAISAKMTKEIEQITKRNKEWMYKKENEHAQALAEKEAEIDSLRASLDELRTRVVESSSRHKPERVRPVDEIPASNGRGAREEAAIPTPLLVGDRRRARSQPRSAKRERESPPEERRDPVLTKRDVVKPTRTTDNARETTPRRASGSKKVKKTKKDLKSEVRAVALRAAEWEEDADDDWDPFAFVE